MNLENIQGLSPANKLSWVGTSVLGSRIGLLTSISQGDSFVVCCGLCQRFIKAKGSMCKTQLFIWLQHKFLVQTNSSALSGLLHHLDGGAFLLWESGIASVK